MVCFINWGRFQLLFDEPCLMCTYLESRFNIVKRVGNTENTWNMCFLSIHKMHIPVPNSRDVHFALVTSEAVAVGTAVQIVVLATVERCAFVGGKGCLTWMPPSVNDFFLLAN